MSGKFRAGTLYPGVNQLLKMYPCARGVVISVGSKINTSNKRNVRHADTVELVYNDHQWSCDRVVVIDKWSFKTALACAKKAIRMYTNSHAMQMQTSN